MSERKTTRFAVLEAERVVKVHEREIPALKADEVLIKNGALFCVGIKSSPTQASAV